MSVKLTIEEEESPRKAIIKIFSVIILAVVSLVVTAMLTLSLVHLNECGYTQKSIHTLYIYFLKILKSPVFLWNAYLNWWDYLVRSLMAGHFRFSLMLPLLAPLLSLFILILAYIRSSYSFSLWYVLHHRFAKLRDVQEMGLINGIMLVLGRFQEHVLGISKPGSVLCFGEAGSGKTSSVAIPSILRSDNACVVTVDNSGSLAKYTSGYRAQIGKVFYFNWDMQEDPDKELFYPRWNPMAKGNLPINSNDCDEYLSYLAEYLVSYDRRLDKDNYWEWLAYVAIHTFLQFMVSKVNQATANDYFLNQILEKGHLNKDDKDTLLSYYVLMPRQYSEAAMANVSKYKLAIDDYTPVGSWDGIPSAWQGKDLCLSMIADWLLQSYLTARDDHSANGDWKDWLEGLLVEARLFNYNKHAVKGLQQLIYLSQKQREIVFPMMLKPLKVFRNKIVREKTSGNDFCMAQMRGIKNSETKTWEPVSIYCTAKTKSTKFVSRMFIEILLRHNLHGYKSKGPFPLLMVVDDVGQMLKIKGLMSGVAKDTMLKMSFLLLCDSLHNLEKVYSKEALEELVANTNYKIVMAEDNIKMSRQLNKLAIYGTKSVQIPLGDKGKHKRAKKGFADSNYYHRLAKNLLARRNLSIVTKGYQLLLVEGFYHCPILTKNPHFIKDEKFRDKSLLSASYFLDNSIVAQRNLQDNKIPATSEVLCEIDLGIDDETELDQYMEIIYNQIVDKMQETPDKTTALADDISAKWSKSPPNKPKQKTLSEDKPVNDWWLDEDAFEHENAKNETNPFDKK